MASLGYSNALVECVVGGSEGGAGVVVKFVGKGGGVGGSGQDMGLLVHCWRSVQAPYVQAAWRMPFVVLGRRGKF